MVYSAILSFLFGICVLHGFAEVPSWKPIAVVLICLLIVFLIIRTILFEKKQFRENQFREKIRPWIHKFLILVFCGLLGFLYSSFRHNTCFLCHYPADLEGESLKIVGTIVSLPEKKENDSYRFEVDVHSAETLTNPAKYWKKPGHIRVSMHDTSEEIHVGEHWIMVVKLKRPHGYSNPGSFDYERQLFLSHIVAEGSVVEWERLKNDWTVRPIDRLREKLCFYIRSNLAGKPLCGPILALVVGVREDITPSQWTIFQDTGTAHLMAIAGLHVGIILLSFLWRLVLRGDDSLHNF